MPEQTTRLKNAVRARSLAEEGVALSMGATAVVVRGSRADAVWRALEPALRAGFTRRALVERFPEKGRPFLEGVLDQLEEHGFLREVEEEHELSESERVAYPHLESLTARPYAALRALAESTVLVRSGCPLLEAELRRALGRAGFREVRADTGSEAGAGAGAVAETGAGVVLTTRLAVPGHGEALHLVAAGHGVWLSGPRNTPGGTGLVERVRVWLDELGPAEPDELPDGSSLRITRSLVAAQLALALVAQVARSAGGTVGADGTGPDDTGPVDPEFMVTTDELVSEPHPFVALPALGDRAAGPLSPGPEPPEEVPEQLDAVAHLWDRVFGPVGEPAPGDLPQLPVGLARVGRSDIHGCGFTTAQARLDALVTALNTAAWPEQGAEPGLGFGLGLSVSAAIGAAVGDLVLRTDGGWKENDPPEPVSAPTRRLWAALTLRFGVPAELRFQELDGTGLWRVDVLGADDVVLGTSAAPEADAAAGEALLRTVARIQLAREDPGADRDSRIPESATRTGSVTASLAEWVRTTGLVSVAAPGGADAWAARGVYTAVAAWT